MRVRGRVMSHLLHAEVVVKLLVVAVNSRPALVSMKD